MLEININNFISARDLCVTSGYTANAIRMKRRNTCWGDKSFSLKKNRKEVLINILEYNIWCGKNSKIKNFSSSQIQFVKFQPFKEFYGISKVELSHFCDFQKIDYNNLVVLAPDGNILVNTLLFKEYLYNLLKFLKVI